MWTLLATLLWTHHLFFPWNIPAASSSTVSSSIRLWPCRFRLCIIRVGRRLILLVQLVYSICRSVPITRVRPGKKGRFMGHRLKLSGEWSVKTVKTNMRFASLKQFPSYFLLSSLTFLQQIQRAETIQSSQGSARKEAERSQISWWIRSISFLKCIQVPRTHFSG